MKLINSLCLFLSSCRIISASSSPAMKRDSTVATNAINPLQDWFFWDMVLIDQDMHTINRYIDGSLSNSSESSSDFVNGARGAIIAANDMAFESLDLIDGITDQGVTRAMNPTIFDTLYHISNNMSYINHTLSTISLAQNLGNGTYVDEIITPWCKYVLPDVWDAYVQLANNSLNITLGKAPEGPKNCSTFDKATGLYPMIYA